MRSFRYCLVLLLALCMIFPLACPAFAANEVITETVDISTIRNAARGPGYYWSNRAKTMTFTNLRLETDDEYGFRFPEGVTLVLNGNSTIRASGYALTALGKMIVKGTGTLTLISDHVGLRMDAPEYEKELILSGGKIIVKAKDIGIQSDYPAVTVGGTELEFDIGDREKGRAISCYTLSLNSGSITSNVPLESRFSMNLGACRMEIDAASPALVYDSLKVGEASTLYSGLGQNKVKIDEYGGEKALTVTAVLSRKTSVLLGKNFGAAWDAVILSVCGVLLAAAIAFPIWNAYRKNRKKRLEVEAKRAEELAAKRAEAKQNKKH